MSHLCIYHEKNCSVFALKNESFVGCCSNGTCGKRRTLERAFTCVFSVSVFSLSGLSCVFPRSRAFRVPCIRVPVLAFVSCGEPNLRILLFMYYLGDLGRGCRGARRYGSFKRTQLHGDRFMASVFPAFKLASLL